MRVDRAYKLWDAPPKERVRHGINTTSIPCRTPVNPNWGTLVVKTWRRFW
jgi:hypothetical protein